MFHLRNVQPTRVVVPSDRVSPTLKFKEPKAVMDGERWLERDLAAGARVLRFLDTDSRVNGEAARAKQRARTVARMPTIRFQQNLIRLTAPGIWGC